VNNYPTTLPQPLVGAHGRAPLPSIFFASWLMLYVHKVACEVKPEGLGMWLKSIPRQWIGRMGYILKDQASPAGEQNTGATDRPSLRCNWWILRGDPSVALPGITVGKIPLSNLPWFLSFPVQSL
jgi:hypothetical protein